MLELSPRFEASDLVKRRWMLDGSNLFLRTHHPVDQRVPKQRGLYPANDHAMAPNKWGCIVLPSHG